MSKNIKGVLGEKLGMTQVWDENNRVVPVTVVKAGPCVVTQVRTNDSDGYEAVQIAFGEIDPRKVNKPLKGHFAKADVTPRRHLVELRTLTPASTRWARRSPPLCSSPASRLTSRARAGQGLRRCHEASQLQGPRRRARHPAQAPFPRFHRWLRHPGRVFKGMRMAGRMGNERVTTQNLTIHAVDARRVCSSSRARSPVRTAASSWSVPRPRGLEVMSTIDILSPAGDKAGTVELPRRSSTRRPAFR